MTQPISACIGESLRWRYSGEVDAKSKFLGKSFEIRPTGTAHVTLFIPKEWAPDYPPASGRPGFVVEHFTFNKVITNISGFVMGTNMKKTIVVFSSAYFCSCQFLNFRCTNNRPFWRYG